MAHIDALAWWSILQPHSTANVHVCSSSNVRVLMAKPTVQCRPRQFHKMGNNRHPSPVTPANCLSPHLLCPHLQLRRHEELAAAPAKKKKKASTQLPEHKAPQMINQGPIPFNNLIPTVKNLFLIYRRKSEHPSKSRAENSRQFSNPRIHKPNLGVPFAF